MKKILPIFIALITLSLSSETLAKLSADANLKCTKYVNSALQGSDVKTRLTLGIDAIDAAAEVAMTENEKRQILKIYLDSIKTDPSNDADIEKIFYLACAPPYLTQDDKDLIKKMLISMLQN